MAESMTADAAPQHAHGSVHAAVECTVPAKPPAPGRMDFWRLLMAGAKVIATLLVAGIAVLIVLMTWQYYVGSPWTRNGIIRVQVANIAPQVSGEIIRLHVVDNQLVRQGDVLYEIDPFNFEIAVRTAQAAVDNAAAEVQVKQAQSDRRQKLSDDATTPEEQQVFAGSALQARAAYDSATQQLAQAKMNLERTKVKSPVDGYVINLLLRVGDFAASGNSNISVVDSDSFWIDGYFEETKLSQICIGDRVEAKLMSYNEPITGRVDTITRGISVGNAAPGTQGLPNVNPIYTWVQLAQRVPIRIAIDAVPSGVPLVSGMTATVTVDPASGSEQLGWLVSLRNLIERLPLLFDAPAPREDCLGAVLQGSPWPERLPLVQPAPGEAPQKIVPGLVPGIDQPPRTN